ncbi:hypothetical protein TNCV_2347761 [Trichonephila clavipes]|nr:hypothetical protein TNCV_2347761 [Trichonephila clavipes]
MKTLVHHKVQFALSKDTREKKFNLLFLGQKRCHEFEPSTTKDSLCRDEMHVKPVESSNVLLLGGVVVKRGQLKYRPRHLTMVQKLRGSSPKALV